ncbi:cyclopropane-fatty-acyl-phospholipid synthase [Epithele typhae]|uniref:cyclopropane-fatty-acyl-phospholipid synthase n=1 Tax=Epithele typhae TaxID=378194 RepID=UPI002007B562|nr:cyclopropane-fatty-acyl-phospholipid synthase [Epithele typhae]KAH9933161.1 cyclopropane-fatty-acyl-phospholipid synthase [Epithele typhae]
MAALLRPVLNASDAFLKHPLCALAETAATTLFKAIAHGALIIHTPQHTYHFGQPLTPHASLAHPPRAPVAELTVRSPNFWLRLCAMGDLGFSEAYMYGEVECNDLINLFMVFLANQEQLGTLENSLLTRLGAYIPQLGLTANIVNTLTNARKNISAHYDISNAMFMGFLSKDMTYSCAIFPELDSDLRDPSPSSSASASLSAATSSSGSPRSSPRALHTGTSTPSTLADPEGGVGDTLKELQGSALRLFHLDGAAHLHHHRPHTPFSAEGEDALEDAQMRKLRHIIRKADIRPGHRVLEIGSGWGSMSILITSSIPGTTVDTLTLSTQQAELARARAAAAGLADRVRVHLLDYRAMPAAWAGAFDRVVSVEMIEAVGQEYFETYWAKIDWALKPDTGVGVVQGITIPEARFEKYMRDLDFIRKWVRSVSVFPVNATADLFPGGFLPTLTFMLDTLAKGSKGRLVVDAVENIGPHYARTLREWRRRFEARFEEAIVPALRKEYPAVMGADDATAREQIEVFRRKWIYYYCYCEIGFTTRKLGDHIVTFTREGNAGYGCHVSE